MKHSILYIVFFLVSTILALANPHAALDHSKAGTDGPYVFYSGKKIIVKHIEVQDGKASPTAVEFKRDDQITLTCTVESTGDVFSFPLRRKHSIPPSTYTNSSKITTLSDIEGNFKGMKMFLIKAGVMDVDFNWTYGKGDLVLVGDFFDRGLQVTECLWLLYKLDAEALAVGGRVHFILGNHEVMNMQGDVQSVRNKYIENAALLGEDYKELYSASSELGRWLRSKNTMEKVGDILFVHGGLSPKMVKNDVSIEQINKEVREQLSLPTEFATRGIASGFTIQNREHPLWFRGMAKNNLNEEQVDAILSHFEVKHIILGHTVMKDITFLHGGKVIIIDQYHSENTRKGFIKSLVIAKGRMYSLCTRSGVKPL